MNYVDQQIIEITLNKFVLTILKLLAKSQFELLFILDSICKKILARYRSQSTASLRSYIDIIFEYLRVKIFTTLFKKFFNLITELNLSESQLALKRSTV